MTVEDIYDLIDKRSPFGEALSWDNSGLLVGSMDSRVSGVYLALDATDQVIEDARAADCELLITHHPLIFTKISRISEDDYVGRRVKHIIEYGMSLICMHTNYDIYGMADAAASRLDLSDTEPLEITSEEGGIKEGIGRIGDLPDLPLDMSIRSLSDTIKASFGVSNVKVFGEADAPVRRCAICPGSGKSVVDEAIRRGADVLVTGDIDHHTGIDACMRGLYIIDAGHYGLEHIFMEEMGAYLGSRTELKIHMAPFKEPFWVV